MANSIYPEKERMSSKGALYTKSRKTTSETNGPPIITSADNHLRNKIRHMLQKKKNDRKDNENFPKRTSMVKLCKSLERSRLKYSSVLAAPFKAGDRSEMKTIRSTRLLLLATLASATSYQALLNQLTSVTKFH